MFECAQPRAVATDMVLNKFQRDLNTFKFAETIEQASSKLRQMKLIQV